MSLLRTEKRQLPVPLTEEEKIDFGRQLADQVEKGTEEIEAQKTTKAAMKERLSEIADEVRRLSKIVARGEEVRTVTVDLHLVGEHVHEIRKDTGEIVVERMRRDEERQGTLTPFETPDEQNEN